MRMMQKSDSSGEIKGRLWASSWLSSLVFAGFFHLQRNCNLFGSLVVQNVKRFLQKRQKHCVNFNLRSGNWFSSWLLVKIESTPSKIDNSKTVRHRQSSKRLRGRWTKVKAAKDWRERTEKRRPSRPKRISQHKTESRPLLGLERTPVGSAFAASFSVNLTFF